MPKGDKRSYSAKQRRRARHIEESYEGRGTARKKAERIAWSTVNKQDGGARGRGAKSPARRGSSSSSRTGRTRSASKSR